MARIGYPSTQRALPADLPEWKLVHRTVPLWGITHYRDGMIEQGRDLGAVGLTVEFGLADGGAMARMIAKSPPMEGSRS